MRVARSAATCWRWTSGSETGAALAVRSAGATIVQPGRGPEPARWDFGVVVGAGASLDWAPEPTVVTDGADYRTSLRIELAAGGAGGASGRSSCSAVTAVWVAATAGVST